LNSWIWETRPRADRTGARARCTAIFDTTKAKTAACGVLLVEQDLARFRIQYARVMGALFEGRAPRESLATPRNAFARPAFVLGPVDSPPWNRQRRFPGTTLMSSGSGLGAASRSEFALQRQPSVRQAALEQLPTPMPFTTGSFRACASGSRTANNGVHQLSLRARKIM
jgi:hypothetical protein